MFISFAGWLRQLSRSGSRHTRRGYRTASRSSPRRTRLALEPLEDRLAPAGLTDTWTGHVSASWNVAGNWNNGVPVAGDALVFPAGASNTTNVNNLAANVLFTSITFQDSGYAISGSTVQLSGGISTPNTVTGVDTVALNVALTASPTFNIDGNGAEVDLIGVVSGAGFGITKTGSGQLVFDGSAANTYTGTTTVAAGTLQLAKSSGNAIAGPLVINAAAVDYGSSNQVADTAAVTVNTSGVLALQGNSDKIGSLSLTSGTVTTGAGTLTVAGAISTSAASLSSSISGNLDLGGATRTVTVADGAAPNDLVVSAAVSDGGITKMGAGTLVLSGANTYAGATTVSVGALVVESSSALGSTAGGTTVAASATLKIIGTGLSFGDALTLNGSGVSGAGALENAGGSNTWAGAISLTTASAVGVDAGLLTLSGVVSGAGGLTEGGAGTLALQGNAANTFTGTTTVNGGILLLAKSSGNAIAGPLVINAAAVDYGSPNQVADTAAVTVNAFGVLALQGNSDKIGSLSLTSGTVTTGAGTLTVAGAISTSAASLSSSISGNLDLGGATRTVTVADGAAPNDLIVSAAVSDGGLTKLGAGTLVLSGTNTYAGTTTVSAGILVVESSSALGSTAGGTTVAASATLKIIGTGLSFGNALTLNGSGATGAGAPGERRRQQHLGRRAISLATAERGGGRCRPADAQRRRQRGGGAHQGRRRHPAAQRQRRQHLHGHHDSPRRHPPTRQEGRHQRARRPAGRRPRPGGPWRRRSVRRDNRRDGQRRRRAEPQRLQPDRRRADAGRRWGGHGRRHPDAGRQRHQQRRVGAGDDQRQPGPRRGHAHLHRGGGGGQGLVILAAVSGGPAIGLTKLERRHPVPVWHRQLRRHHHGEPPARCRSMTAPALGSGAATVAAGASLVDDGLSGITTALTLNGTGVGGAGALQGSGEWQGPVTLAAATSVGRRHGRYADPRRSRERGGQPDQGERRHARFDGDQHLHRPHHDRCWGSQRPEQSGPGQRGGRHDGGRERDPSA